MNDLHHGSNPPSSTIAAGNDARTGAHPELRAMVLKGIDPVSDRRNAKAAVAAKADVPTFGTMADQYIAAHEAGWRNAEHRWQWKRTLGQYCGPIRALPVDQIDAKAVLKVLTPIWTATPETASRLRGRIEVILASAQVAGHVDPDKPNPARWKNWLDHMLPPPKKLGVRGHHAAMPYDELPEFMARFAETPGIAAKALVFLILTATRTTETLGAQWDEISFQTETWVIPSLGVKSKCLNRAEFVVVGWSDPEGSCHLVGSLLLGYYDPEGRLIYAGRAGTGMSVQTLAMLHQRLEPLATVEDAAVLPSAAEEPVRRPAGPV